MDYFVDWLTRLFERIGNWAEDKEKQKRDRQGWLPRTGPAERRGLFYLTVRRLNYKNSREVTKGNWSISLERDDLGASGTANILMVAHEYIPGNGQPEWARMGCVACVINDKFCDDSDISSEVQSAIKEIS